MKACIQSIQVGSAAQAAGLQTGDVVMAVEGMRNLEDMFDFQFALMDEAAVSLTIERGGETLTCHVKKDPDDMSLGLVFESPVFTPIKTCNNACPFCFIDQQPAGLRASLYVKDDDYRLSYFCNTYITLTNLTQHDIQRIERIRPGPLYVSVHSTVPEIRKTLLMNPKAGDIMDKLRWLGSLDIPFHAQLVICPGINDGDSLTHTLEDLATLQPHCLSVAVVPVGLTQFRGNLPGLIPMTPEIAQDVIHRVAAFHQHHGLSEFAFASDEFYVIAKTPLPQYQAYGDFPQLDDGVGSTQHLLQSFWDHADSLPPAISPEKKWMIVTGKLGAMALQPIVQRLNQIDGLFMDLVCVENRFWGEAVTVSGLITGQDILNTLQNQDLAGYTGILLPQTMLKSGATLFLDGLSISELEQQLGCPITVVENPQDASSLLETLFPATLKTVIQ